MISVIYNLFLLLYDITTRTIYYRSFESQNKLNDCLLLYCVCLLNFELYCAAVFGRKLYNLDKAYAHISLVDQCIQVWNRPTIYFFSICRSHWIFGRSSAANFCVWIKRYSPKTSQTILAARLGGPSGCHPHGTACSCRCISRSFLLSDTS